MSRVVEIGQSFNRTLQMLPDSTAEAIARHYDWLKPHFFDDAVGDLAARIQSFIVRTPEHTVLIDTGVGNDKRRPDSLAWHQRQGKYLADLRAAGLAPEDVDLVLCTHLHVDHVGWNTRLERGPGGRERWVPTFPKATYVFAGEEWEFWRHESESGREASGCIADSVLPVVEAGRARFVSAPCRIDPWLSYEPWVGHTPGHVAVRLRTSAGSAIFAGDLMHRTVQVAEPQWSSKFCYDPARAALTRREFVERHADSGELVLPAHFPHPGRIVKTPAGFRFEPVMLEPVVHAPEAQ